MHEGFDQRFRVALTDRFDDTGIARRENYADPRLREVHHGQTDEERCGGYDLEIDQRFDAHPSDLSQRAGAGDSDDNC
jgi:hypothetical protein